MVCAESFIVEQVRGSAIFKTQQKKSISLKKGLEVEGEGVIQTEKKSFVRIKLPQGLITVGPSSKVKVGASPNIKEPSVLELMSGKLRGQIEKYDIKKHKLFIKTRSASSGVRGTDFLLIYNPENHITSNLTFKGEVDFYKKKDERILESLKEDLDQKNGYRVDRKQTLDMEDQLYSDNVVRIKGGNFSGAYPTYDSPLPPTRISLNQFNALKRNVAIGKKGKTGNIRYGVRGKKKKYQLTNKNLIPEPKGKVDKSLLAQVPKVKSRDQIVRHGGILDTETGMYVMPPKGSKYNEKTGLYEVPSEYGGIDMGSGTYVPPENVELDPILGFVRLKNGKRKQVDSFGKSVTKLFNKYKEKSRVDLYADARYYYSTKSYENYYGEPRFNSEAETMIFDFAGSIGRHLYHNKRYLHYLKGEINMIWHNRQDESRVQRNDRLVFLFGYEFHRKHRVFGREARLIFDLEFETVYQDYRNRSQWDFYTESTNFNVFERFKTSRYHQVEVGYGISAFQGFEDQNHGNIHKILFNNLVKTSKSWSFGLNYFFSQRVEKMNDNDLYIHNLDFVIKRHNLFRKADIELKTGHNFYDSKRNFLIDKGDTQKYMLSLFRRKGEYLKFHIYYQYLINKSNGGTENRDFISHLAGAGIRFIF